MTSVQTKKGGTGNLEKDRQSLLKQMKVRTKLKTDKSWINQGSEDEKDTVSSPVSPQLKALEGRKLWSPTSESEPNRNSGLFTAKEVITSASSPPVQSVNRNSGFFTAKEVFTSTSSPPVQSVTRQFSYNSNETNTSPSATSKPSPPPSTTGNRPATSYIIRGQPVNAVSQVKSPPSYNGYQKSQVQARTTSLPRVPTATGYKMSTEEYKKLAPYNIRSKSTDLSDDETPYTPQEQVKRTEQASSVLRNTTSKDRSYVISAAKRNSGVVPQDSGSQFLAKRVEIQDEETGNNRRSQTLPKTLPSEDSNRHEQYWPETQTKQTSSQSSPSRVTERSSSPRLTSYSMTSSVDGRSSPVKPEAGKITVVREESRNDSRDVSKPLTQRESTTTTHTTRTERVTERSSSPRLTSYSVSGSVDGSSPVKPETGKITVIRNERVESKDKKDETLPKSLHSYLYEDANRFEKNWNINQTVQPTLQTSPARVEATDKTDEMKSLESYLYEDASRFENSWKTDQTVQPTIQTSPPRASDRPESPRLMSWNTETRSSSITPEPGKISVLRQESDKITPKPTESRSSSRTVTTTVESGNIIPDIPKLTSYRDVTDTRTSQILPGPGKITVLTQESQKETPKVTTQASSTTRIAESNTDSPDIPILTSSSITRTLTETETPIMQAGPGKITIIREEDSKPKPVIRTETKPKETLSDKQPELISWSDLDNTFDNRFPKETQAAAPTPAARNTNRGSEKPADEVPLIVISPELDNKRSTQPPRVVENNTEARYRVAESLDDPKPISSSNGITSNAGNRNVRISVETLSEQPRTTETTETDRSSSPRPSPRSRESTTTTTVTETRYRVPETLEDTIRESSPSRITSNAENRNVRISIETLSEQPRTTETTETVRSSSPRPTPRSRESTSTTTVTESRYRVPEKLEDTMLESSPSRSNTRTTVTTTRSTDPLYTEYIDDRESRTTRTVSSSREQITTTTTMETQYDNASSGETNQYDQSSNNKGILFVKEYVNTTESLKSPTTAGSFPNFSDNSEMVSYSSSSSYLYNSAPRSSGEGPCTYCGREIKDCAKIMLDHLNIYCHEYCFKCGICNKPMGDLVDSIFIHRDVVHCESCYEKLF